MPLVIAHRGASAEHPENSLAAFARAVELGVDGIELDVHATADGVLVVHHDPEIAGHSVQRTPHSALRPVRLPNGESLPTLDEALATIGPHVIAFIEVKSLPREHDAALFAAIDRAPAPDKCHIHGFDHRIVQRLRQARSSLSCGVLSASYPVRPVAQLEEAGATVLWQHHTLVDRALVDAVHAMGGRLYVWTVDDPDAMRAFKALAVDGVCSNRPDVARKALA